MLRTRHVVLVVLLAAVVVNVKINEVEKQFPDISGLVKKTVYNAR